LYAGVIAMWVLIVRVLLVAALLGLMTTKLSGCGLAGEGEIQVARTKSYLP